MVDKNQLVIEYFCESEKNLHGNLQFVMRGLWKRWQMYLVKHSRKMTSVDALRTGRLVWSDVSLRLEIIVKGTTCRSNDFIHSVLVL